MNAEPLTYRTAGITAVRIENDRRLWSGYSVAYGVTLVTAGAFDFWYRRRVRTQSDLELKLKEPGEVHRDLRVHAPVSAISIGLSPERISEAAERLGYRPGPHFQDVVVPALAPLRHAALALYRALRARRASSLSVDSCAATLIDALLSRFAESRRDVVLRAHPGVERARQVLHDRIAENVTLSELECASGLDRFQLLRRFKRDYGLPPHQYRTHLRIALARSYLAGGKPIAEIAAELGFYDQSQLHRHFRRIVGTTPGRLLRTS